MPTFQEVLFSIPGLTHYYPLSENADDIVGGAHGTIHGNVRFEGGFAKFDGSSSIELPDSNDFSIAGTASKALSIHVYQTVDDWTRVSHNNEYIHWAGKGRSGAYEWTFRHYKDGGGGEAPERKRRTSFYAFNTEGNLGAGSFFQDEGDGVGVERYIVAIGWGNAGNGGKIQMWKNATKRDEDLMSSYDIYPEVTSSNVFLGTRGDNTGYLVGRLRRVAFFDRQLNADEIKKLYDARTYEEGDGSGAGGGETPPVQTAEILINGEVFPLSGLNVDRDSGALVAYSPAYGSKTDTNEWGAEVKVEGGKVTEILDQQEAAAGDHNLEIGERGYVLSGHGEARTFLLDNASIGARAGFTDIVLPTPPPDGGGGEGGDVDLTAIKAAYDEAYDALHELTVKMTALGGEIDAAGA